jgi:Cof subfamily protein (haloacid dehalogenase superfamily)
MDNRRQYKRLSYKTDISCLIDNTEETFVLIDISRGGISFLSSHIIDNESLISLNFGWGEIEAGVLEGDIRIDQSGKAHFRVRCSFTESLSNSHWSQLMDQWALSLPEQKNENIQMVVFDLDGTLVNHDFTLAESSIAAVREIVGAGYRVSVATGRSYKSAKPFLDALEITEPMVFSNGAVFDNPDTGEREMITGIPLETALIVIMLLKEIPISLKVHLADGTVYKSDSTPWPDEGKHFDTGIISDNLAAELDEDPVKIVFHGDEEKIQQLVGRLNDILGNKQSVRLFRSHTNYMELTHKKVSKGHAVQLLMEKLEIEMDSVIALGDMDNDLEMIRDAGIGIIAGEGTDALKEVTPYHIPSPEDGGISKFKDWLLAE